MIFYKNITLISIKCLQMSQLNKNKLKNIFYQYPKNVRIISLKYRQKNYLKIFILVYACIFFIQFLIVFNFLLMEKVSGFPKFNSFTQHAQPTCKSLLLNMHDLHSFVSKQSPGMYLKSVSVSVNQKNICKESYTY